MGSATIAGDCIKNGFKAVDRSASKIKGPAQTGTPWHALPPYSSSIKSSEAELMQ